MCVCVCFYRLLFQLRSQITILKPLFLWLTSHISRLWSRRPASSECSEMCASAWQLLGFVANTLNKCMKSTVTHSGCISVLNAPTVTRPPACLPTVRIVLHLACMFRHFEYKWHGEHCAAEKNPMAQKHSWVCFYSKNYHFALLTYLNRLCTRLGECVQKQFNGAWKVWKPRAMDLWFRLCSLAQKKKKKWYTHFTR